MMTTTEAKSLGGIARQVRALLNGIDKLPEAIDEVEGLEGRRDAAKREHRALESDIATLRAVFDTLDADYRALQKQYGQLDQEYRDKKQTLEASLNTVRGDLDAANQLKQELDDALALLKAKLT